MEKKTGTLGKILSVKRKLPNNNEYDTIITFYRDQDGAKHVQLTPRAKVPFYTINDTTLPEAENPPMFIERSKVDEHICYSDTLFREVAAKTKAMHYYDTITINQGKNSRALQNLFKHKHVYNSDMDIVDRYVKYFNDEFEPDMGYKLHKCYYDIEVDLMPNGWKDKGFIGFPDESVAPCPINIITIIDGKSLAIHTFVVRNPENKSQVEFESGVEEFKKYLHEKILTEDGVDISEINITFFNDEMEAIQAYFDKMHEIDPDFALAWNSHFDLETMFNRLCRLASRKKELKEQGIKAKDYATSLMCDKKYIYFKEADENIYITPKYYYYCQNDKPFTDRSDSITIMDGITWMDQMCVYANIRKSQGQKESYALDAIAYDELKKEKLPFHPGQTIKNLAWLNFHQFAEYNIRDVLLLHLLEEKNLDMEMIQRLSEITNTKKEKVFKKTVSLKNFVNKFAEENGFVMSNNKNAHYGDDGGLFEAKYIPPVVVKEDSPQYKEAFAKKENYGAFVADPAKNEPLGIEGVSSKKSKFIYENVFDEDLSALYPSIIRSFNLDKNTQIGKFFLIDDEIKSILIDKFGYDGLFTLSKNEEAAGKTEEDVVSDLGPTITDSLMSKDWGRIGEKYFALPNTEEMLSELSGIIRKV